MQAVVHAHRGEPYYALASARARRSRRGANGIECARSRRCHAPAHEASRARSRAAPRS
jgi:hypothetical protein